MNGYKKEVALYPESLVGAVELNDADLSKVQGGGGYDHGCRQKQHDCDYRQRRNNWQDDYDCDDWQKHHNWENRYDCDDWQKRRRHYR